MDATIKQPPGHHQEDHHDMKSSVHCLTVSSGLVTVWPSVLSELKIS